MRLITTDTLLYTEMISAKAILHGKRDFLLGYSEEEKPLALQVGSDDPAEAAECAKIAADWGYDEINLNVGCPSERVQNGNFGACLMAEPQRVARIIEAMTNVLKIPVTVKCRIGINGRESYEELAHFIKVIINAGCRRFIIHARIAILGGLSPKENRSVPPLRYEVVYRIKRDFADLNIEINGGITSTYAADGHLKHVDRVMIGRAAIDNPWIFSTVDDVASEKTRESIVIKMMEYIEKWQTNGLPARKILRHMLGLYHAQKGARLFRRAISAPYADSQTVRDILSPLALQI